MKITKNVIKHEKLVPFIMKETRYLLDLDFSEVRFLRDVCDRIGGCPDRSRRGIADKLIEALKSVGVGGLGVHGKKDIEPGISIYFKNTDTDGADQ